MSGRWRDRESPPHSSPTAELGGGAASGAGWHRPRGHPGLPGARLLSPVPHPRARDAAGAFHRPPEGGAAAQAPREPARGAGLPPRRALPPPGCASAAQGAAVQPGPSAAASPQSPGKSNSEQPAGPPQRAAGSGGASAWWSRTQRSAGGHFAERAGPRRPAPPDARSPGTDARRPRPRSSRLTWQDRRLSGMLGPRSSGPGGQLTSLPSAPRGRGPAGSLRCAHGAAPTPHPPTPSVKSVTALLPPDLLQSLRTVARSWALMPGALARLVPCPALPRPSAPGRPGRRGGSAWSPSLERPSRLP